MKKKLIIVMSLLTLIVLICSGIYYLNNTKTVEQLINDETFKKCHLIKDDRNIYVDSKKEIQEIFNTFYKKKCIKMLPWEKKRYTTYYCIITQDNGFIIYDYQYIALTIGYKEVMYKLTEPIEANILDEFFEGKINKSTN
jgi:hypothetical protein